MMLYLHSLVGCDGYEIAGVELVDRLLPGRVASDCYYRDILPHRQQNELWK